MSRASLFPYAIPRRHTRCCSCNSYLSPGSAYYTSLLLESSAAQRKDLCSTCRDEQGELAKEGQIFWLGRIPSTQENELNQSWTQRAVALLRDLSTNDCKEAMGQAFLLALYLVRQKIIALRHEEQKSDEERPLLWYEVLHAGELLAIRHARLRELPDAELQQRLVERLQFPT